MPTIDEVKKRLDELRQKEQGRYRIALMDNQALELLHEWYVNMQLLETLPKTKRSWHGKEQLNPIYKTQSEVVASKRRQFWTRAQEVHPDIQYGVWSVNFYDGVVTYQGDDTKA